MIGHMEMVDLTKNDYQILEFYAGAKRVAKLGAAMGLRVAAMDKIYDKEGNNITKNNCMDLNTSAGFLFLTLYLLVIISKVCSWTRFGTVLFQIVLDFWDFTMHGVLLFQCPWLPRLACILILESRWEDFLALFGICCSTFVSISRGSTHRSAWFPLGCPISLAVYKANKGVSRQECEKTNIKLTFGHFGCGIY